jgi:hypothetical protein
MIAQPGGAALGWEATVILFTRPVPLEQSAFGMLPVDAPLNAPDQNLLTVRTSL